MSESNDHRQTIESRGALNLTIGHTRQCKLADGTNFRMSALVGERRFAAMVHEHIFAQQFATAATLAAVKDMSGYDLGRGISD
jgi:hypothetical protein